MSAFGVGLLSFAHSHAMGYARDLRADPRVQVVGAWDEEAARGRARAAELEVPYVEELDALLGNPQVQGVVCNSPSNLHPDLLIAAARAGKHIFSEKVLALTVGECDRIVESVRQAKVRFVLSMPGLCEPEHRWLKHAVETGQFGRITYARARIGHLAAVEHWFEEGSWFGDAQRAGGGALMDLGAHPVYRMRDLLGSPSSLVARMTNVTGAYGVEDNAVAITEFASGALGVIEATWADRGPQGVAIQGTDGWAWVGSPGGLVAGGRAFTGHQDGMLRGVGLPQGWPRPLQQWIASVVEGRDPEIQLEWGRWMTEIMEAAYRSVREGRSVSWSEFGAPSAG